MFGSQELCLFPQAPRTLALLSFPLNLAALVESQNPCHYLRWCWLGPPVQQASCPNQGPGYLGWCQISFLFLFFYLEAPLQGESMARSQEGAWFEAPDFLKDCLQDNPMVSGGTHPAPCGDSKEAWLARVWAHYLRTFFFGRPRKLRHRLNPTQPATNHNKLVFSGFPLNLAQQPKVRSGDTVGFSLSELKPPPPPN